MSDMNEPGELPSDLPPEYAEAYRRGYRRAYDQSAPVPSAAGAEPTTQMSIADWFSDTDRPAESSAGDAASDDRERPRWLVPTLLAVLALALILAAYLVGRAFSSSVASTNAQNGQNKLVIPATSGAPSGGASGGSTGTATPSQQPGTAYTGATDLASVSAAGASCQSADAFDAGGNKISYAPNNVFDQDMSTAWRCNGDGHGVQLTITLASKMPIGEVGMVPGYAKTDPYDGADRYAENDRITKVRWTFDDGHSVVQKLDGSAHDRRMQTMRIPVTTTGSLRMTILGTTPGPRHTVAVSEVRIGRVAD